MSHRAFLEQPRLRERIDLPGEKCPRRLPKLRFEGAGVVTPSPARELPKGAQLMGAQVVTTFTAFDAPATLLVALEGRNGLTDDDWVLIFQGAVPIIDDAGPFNVMAGGFDLLVPIGQFAETRLNMIQLTGVPGDLVDLSVTAHCKSDYLTG